ncbi:MAG: glycosyltransferase family 2 protein [Methylovirgula sp.]
MTKIDIHFDPNEQLRQLEERIAQKDAQIAQLARELSQTKIDAKANAAQLRRDYDELATIKNAQVAECLNHLRCMNASPLWRLAKGVSKLLSLPAHMIASARSAKAVATVPHLANHLAHADRYRKWVSLYDTLIERDREEIKQHIFALQYHPPISLVILASDDAGGPCREAIASVKKQLYGNWELCVVIDARSPGLTALVQDMAAADARVKLIAAPDSGGSTAAKNIGLAAASGEFLALINCDVLLPEQALYEFAVALNAHPNSDLLYADEDRIGQDGVRHSPYFKGDWNPELFLAHDMISSFAIYRRSLLTQLGGWRDGLDGYENYDVALRVAAATSEQNIQHIPALLSHRRTDAKSCVFSHTQAAETSESLRRAKRDLLSTRGETVAVETNPYVASFDRIRRSVPMPAPLVTLIVPTHNRHDLLGPCIDGLLNRTHYRPLEIIIIDHQSDNVQTLALLKRLNADPRVRIMRYEGQFNYSDMNNRAAVLARGDIIGFVNNDIDVIDPDWLAEMVSFAVLPENGAIGAKLLYPDGRVQHGGVILGMPWGIDHAQSRAMRDEAGYFGRLVQATNVSAVTAACLLVRKRLFDDVGGFNAVDLPVSCNDVDLCLEFSARGYRNVWTPFALLYHHESVSRGSDMATDNLSRANRELDYMRHKWRNRIEADPYFNVNLSLQNPAFGLAFPPRRTKPWRATAAYEADALS